MNLNHDSSFHYTKDLKTFDGCGVMAADVRGFFNDRVVDVMATRKAHNLIIGGSNPFHATNGTLPKRDKGRIKLVSDQETHVDVANQAAGIKEVSGTPRETKNESVDFRGGIVTPFKDMGVNGQVQILLGGSNGPIIKEVFTLPVNTNGERENVSNDCDCLQVFAFNNTFLSSLFYGYRRKHLSRGVSCASKNGSDSNQLKQGENALRGVLHSVENQSCELPIKIKSIQRERGGIVAGSGETCGILGLQLNNYVR